MLVGSSHEKTPSITFDEFDASYRALTDHDGACRWQYRLFGHLEAGMFPSDIELATGLGKTTIIALWILALGHTIARSPCVVPRRLAYVVDRRVVVDQASEFAEEVRARLDMAAKDERHILHSLAANLRAAGCTPSVLEISTLRGERSLDTGWRDDPARPAIIVGTVDMLGSRLLFSAYGRVGPWGRSLEAGLLGQDCLLVLDEAHLCSPFAATLAAIERRRDRIATFAVIRMGATMAPATQLLRRMPGLSTDVEPEESSEARNPFRLLPTEIAEKKVSDRLNALKLITPTPIAGKVGIQIAEWAMEKAREAGSDAIGLVFNTVVEARRCVEHLRGCEIPMDRIAVLTGSMRGWDRDAVVESVQYARFKSNRDRSSADGPVFLVATSCVEVGADIDCDHLGTEACAADSLIQRLGRVNRLGLRKQGASVLVVGNPQEDDPGGRVFTRLCELTCCGTLDGAAATFPARLLSDENDSATLLDVRVPPPALTSAVLDDLAMTSKYPKTGARPDISRWLHGSIEEAEMYVELAWRAELDWITEPEGAARLLDAFPISARETARCPLYEAVEVLAAIRARCLDDSVMASKLVIVTRYGVTEGRPLGSLAEEELRQFLRNTLVVLPVSVGGYDGHFVDPNAGDSVVDVAEEAQPPSRARRRRLWVKSGSVSMVTTKAVEPANIDSRLVIDADTREDELIAEVTAPARLLLGPGWRLIECAGDANKAVVVVREVRRTIDEAEEDDASLGFRAPVMLDKHLDDARTRAEALCRLLRLPRHLQTAVVEAAGNHDLGKNRPWWQRAVGRVEKPPVAKSGQVRFDHAINQGYRHELGSVADLQGSILLNSLDPDVRDLCLHLIAAHHGHARPGFRYEAAGPILTNAVREAFDATPARFARTQATHGRWGLAFLEALVKAADVLASREEEDAAS